VRAEPDIGQVRQFLHAQNAARDAWLAEVDGTSASEIQTLNDQLDRGAARDAQWRNGTECRRRGTVAGGMIDIRGENRAGRKKQAQSSHGLTSYMSSDPSKRATASDFPSGAKSNPTTQSD